MLADNLMLPSFILTVTTANTNSGQLSENVTTTGLINEPFSVYQVATYSSDGTTDGSSRYLVDGRSYEVDPSGSWYLFEAGSPSTPGYLFGLDLRTDTLSGVLTADLAGQEDYAGIPANHFVFDETDLTSYSNFTPDNPSPAVQGDFYLAQESNYVLYTHYKQTSPDSIYEVTEALSSIGQVAEITLPAEFAPMTQALDIGVALGRLLPGGTVLSSMIRYEHGIGIDYYDYVTPVRTIDDFLNFYRTRPQTDGWTVSHIGHITPHIEQINCETKFECIILNNGGDQIVISFEGIITVEYDRDHIFRPI